MEAGSRQSGLSIVGTHSEDTCIPSLQVNAPCREPVALKRVLGPRCLILRGLPWTISLKVQTGVWGETGSSGIAPLMRPATHVRNALPFSTRMLTVLCHRALAQHLCLNFSRVGS